MSPLEIAEVLEQFVRRQFHVRPNDAEFSRDAHLFEHGYVDSAGVVELVAYVESRFGVKLEDEHIFSDLFPTINGLSGIISMCLGLL